MMKRVLLLLLCFPVGSLVAQVLEIDPPFPNRSQRVTIVYNAKEGNKALMGVTKVYCHTGLITSKSTSPGNWQFVKGRWGQADSMVEMEYLGDDLHRISFHIDSFYGAPASETLLRLAFVFRNANGSIVGRDTDGSDMFYDIFPDDGRFRARFFNDRMRMVTREQLAKVTVKSNQAAHIQLWVNQQLIAADSGVQTWIGSVQADQPGMNTLVLIATNGQDMVYDTSYLFLHADPVIAPPPPGLHYGCNIISPDSIVLKLYQPHKQHVYAVGDFNQWTPSPDYMMNRSEDGSIWWLSLGKLTSGKLQGYQYLIDGQSFADPMSTLIADPVNDGFISRLTYPNPYVYPVGKTSGFISLYHLNKPAYDWKYDQVKRPAKTDLLIYELLVRDFVSTRNYLTIMDSLPYLKSLGINAIELMPVGEFENNESWGYNPSFHMALDKYYGTPDHFKQFIDECHRHGIAVILDIVLNHLFGQSPMVRMYWNANSQKPMPQNPWLNEDCPHEPYCWGYDLNHETKVVQDYMDQVNLFWLQEYHLDGFRFDYTKGFLNANANYSDVRIQLLKRMADVIWNDFPEAYIILEHWADNQEEKALSDYGMLLWANLTHNYHQIIKGFSSNLNNSLYYNRGWNDPHMVTYVESHDEERALFEALQNGNNSNSEHNTRQLNIALKRKQAVAALSLLTPGPKMIWQFGEIGYDVSINNPCRVCNKPLLWNYLENPGRRQLYDVYGAIIKLRELDRAMFAQRPATAALVGNIKRLAYRGSTFDLLLVTNFGLQSATANTGFTRTGWWYDYFGGDSLWVENTAMTISMDAGHFVIYTSKKLPQPELTAWNSYTPVPEFSNSFHLYPNPCDERIFLQQIPIRSERVEITLLDVMGRIIRNYTASSDALLVHGIDTEKLSPGTYILQLKDSQQVVSKRFIKNHR
jgi:1,4-alpha-glucan branching enzyme